MLDMIQNWCYKTVKHFTPIFQIMLLGTVNHKGWWNINKQKYFKQAIPVVFEYAINKIIKTSLDTTLLIIYHQWHVSAM